MKKIGFAPPFAEGHLAQRWTVHQYQLDFVPTPALLQHVHAIIDAQIATRAISPLSIQLHLHDSIVSAWVAHSNPAQAFFIIEHALRTVEREVLEAYQAFTKAHLVKGGFHAPAETE